VQVFEHLQENTKSWRECMANHGLDPEKVERALSCKLREGDSRLETAAVAFVFGLQFGGMRLAPFEGYEEKPCECPFCVMRRAAEAKARGEQPPDAEES
jgi:hypothetical protein